MIFCRRYVVSGQVQGVFYRASTEATARRLGLNGWVRNLPDGRVELVACGEEATLKQLEKWLWQGPPHAQVEQVQCEATALAVYDGFSVVR
jgi:acylphosphatase